MNPPEDGTEYSSGVYGEQGELVLAFDNQAPAYSAGFEAGMLWGCLTLARAGFTLYLRDETLELAMRMAVAKGFLVRLIGDSEDFVHLEFRRAVGELPSMPEIESLPEGER